jgi:carbonic anhydrase
MDPRFWPKVLDLVSQKHKLAYGEISLIQFPGSCKCISRHGSGNELMLQGLEIAVKKHGVQTIVAVSHQDCGGYGGSEEFQQNRMMEFASYEADLRSTHAILARRYPKISILTHIAVMQEGEVELMDMNVPSLTSRPTTLVG